MMIRKNKSELRQQIEKNLNPSKKKEERFKKSDLLPMGSTLLNLAMSDTIYGGALKGKMINIIGASHGGKSILGLSSFAEAAMRPDFKNYKLIYDDVERANSFDMPILFGDKAAQRIQPPRPHKANECSTTIQDLQANIFFNIEKGSPFIYVNDSFDALTSLEDEDKLQKLNKSLEEDTKTTGSYGLAKAKLASSMFRHVVSHLDNTNSILIIISQTRDNISPLSSVAEVRSGGRALKFYAHHEIWLKPIKQIKSKNVVIGNLIEVKVTKNKITGKKRNVRFEIYNDYGIDDIGSCIDFLIEKGRWGGGGRSSIDHKGDFSFPKCTKQKLIQKITDLGLEQELRLLVKEEWDIFEESLKLNRKPKYG